MSKALFLYLTQSLLECARFGVLGSSECAIHRVVKRAIYRVQNGFELLNQVTVSDPAMVTFTDHDAINREFNYAMNRAL